MFKNNKDFLTKKQDGYYDRSHSHVCIINASTTLQSQAKLTTAEYLGLILHEIGHNFDTSIYSVIDYVFNYLNYLTTYSWMRKSQGRTKYAEYRLKELEDINKKYNQRHSNEIHKYQIRMEKFFSVFNFLISVPIMIMVSPISHLLFSNTRKAEEFADSFATAYGYGSEMIIGLQKITDNDLLSKQKGYRMKHFDKFLTDLALARRYVIYFSEGTHGSNDARLVTSINMLKKDLKSRNYPPELKEDLNEEIIKLERIYKLFMSPTIYDNDEKLYISNAVRKLIRILFGKRNDYIAKIFPNNLARNDVRPKK